MNYCEALDKLGSLHYLGSRLGLGRMIPLLESVGSPQYCYPYIHVTGTKGKGSTSLMISNIMQASGYKVGLYTSPHLQSLRERIRVNGELITTGEFSDLVDTVSQVAEGLDSELGPATFFEVMTAMAMLHFKNAGTHVGIFEVGLGGRLDATNVVEKPACSVITAISYDHMGILGDTLERIAKEKAGIIKKNCPLICAKQPAKALETLLGRAKDRNATVSIQGKDFDYIDRGAANGIGQTMDYHSDFGTIKDIFVPLLGEHQLQNASIAIRAAEVTSRNVGLKISEDAIKEGIKNSFWPCRLEVFPGEPTIILDGAHNGASADALAHALRRHFKYNSLTMVVGLLRDKDTTRFIRALAPMANKIIATTPSYYRKLSSDKLCMRFRRRLFECDSIDNPADAVVKAIESTPKGGAVLVTGSLYLVGEMRTLLGQFALAK